jgi:hypothetical protein
MRWMGRRVRWGQIPRGLRAVRAIKANLVDVQITFTKLAVFRKCELDRNSATTLLVDNIDPVW